MSDLTDRLTIEDVAARLGLQPLATYRHSGRTTTMLCNALATVASGKHVLILGHSSHYTMDLVRNARRMAHTCGLDGGLISAARQDAVTNPLYSRGHSEDDVGDPLFVDHYNPPICQRLRATHDEIRG